MKKTITFITALLISCSTLASCGGSSGDGSKGSAKVSTSYSRKDTESTTTEVEKTIIDPFENISYKFKSYYVGANDDDFVYPDDLGIEFDASNTPLGTVATYTYFIESADESEIIIKARANIDEYAVTNYMEENNYAVEKNEKTFTISTSEMRTRLLTADALSGENKKIVVDTMQNYIDSTANEYFDLNDSDIEFTLEKLYLMMPTNTEYELKTQKEKSEIHSYTDDSQFEDIEIFENKAVVGFLASDAYSFNRDYHGMYGIFKDSNGTYYCVDFSNVVFENGELVLEGKCHGGVKKANMYESLESAYENGPIHAKNEVMHWCKVDEDYFTITELPID